MLTASGGEHDLVPFDGLVSGGPGDHQECNPLLHISASTPEDFGLGVFCLAGAGGMGTSPEAL